MVAEIEGVLADIIRLEGIKDMAPATAVRDLWQGEHHIFMRGAKQQQHGALRPYPQQPGRLRAPIQQHTNTLQVPIAPGFFIHLLAAGVKPGDIFDIQLLIQFTAKETAAVQNGKTLTQGNQTVGKQDGNAFK